MKLPQMGKKRPWNYLALAFGLPAGLMLILMFVTSATPFGEYSMLYSDMFHQYYPFFNAFRKALRSGESLLWSWSAGMGMDYLGLISYYLASPLNLFSVLVPDSMSLGYFAMLMPIKLGLAGLSFGYMLKKLFEVDDLSISVFGCLYGLCAWALGYQWNVMWLDTFALLPLVALGTVLLLRDKKYILYTWSLFLSIFANYYIGFFICIFVFLLFFCYEICRFKSIGRFMTDLGRIALFSILAIGMTAVLELPALASLQKTHSSVNNFPEGFQVNIVSGEAVDLARAAWEAYRAAKEAGEGTWGLLWDALKASFGPLTEAMAKVAGNIGGGKTLTYMEGLPNLYCGVLPVVLGFLFLLAKQVKVRDKICCVALLLFFMQSFIIRQLDYIWHGFHFTNQIPYRFSFLFSFVVLYMAYRAWLLRDQFKIWQILAATVLSAGLMLISEENRSDLTFLTFNFSFLALYLTAMLAGHAHLFEKPVSQPESAPVAMSLEQLPEEAMVEEEAAEEEARPVGELLEQEQLQPVKKSWLDYIPSAASRRRYAALAIACLILVELVLDLANFASTFGIYNYDYPKKEDTVSGMLSIMHELDNGQDLFYRTEVTRTQTLNDGPLNGYYGLSTFSSSANVQVTRFMMAMGGGAMYNWNRYCYEDASPVANLFLNLKYQIERDIEPGPNEIWKQLHYYNDVYLMENTAYLPLGFLTQPELADLEFKTGNSFNFQNKLFQAATGTTEKVWSTISAQDVTVVGENIDITTKNAGGYSSYTAKASGGKLMYEYVLKRDGYMCLEIDPYYNGRDVSVWYNDRMLFRDNYNLPQMAAVCSVKAGDKVQVVVECKASETSSIVIRAGLMNESTFREGYDILNASTLQLTQFSSTRICGTIDCNRDGLLYTSIPQDGNWKAFVDGKEVQTKLVGDAMLALDLTQGQHTLEFRYESRAFTLGLLVSLGCGLVFVGIIGTQHLIRRKRKKA